MAENSLGVFQPFLQVGVQWKTTIKLEYQNCARHLDQWTPIGEKAKCCWLQPEFFSCKVSLIRCYLKTVSSQEFTRCPRMQWKLSKCNKEKLKSQILGDRRAEKGGAVQQWIKVQNERVDKTHSHLFFFKTENTSSSDWFISTSLFLLDKLLCGFGMGQFTFFWVLMIRFLQHITG